MSLGADLSDWSISVIAGLGGGANKPEVLDGTERTYRLLENMFREEVTARRGREGDDFLSRLMLAEFEGDRLSDDEVISTGIMTILAGNDTTANTIGLSAVALAQNPDRLVIHARSPRPDADTIMEMMRYVAMSTAQTRTVPEDFDWHGRQLKKGDMVLLVIAGANRDLAKFTDPEALDPTRRPEATSHSAQACACASGTCSRRRSLKSSSKSWSNFSTGSSCWTTVWNGMRACHFADPRATSMPIPSASRLASRR